MTRRCRKGHNNSSPLCAVCEVDYIMINEMCDHCKGYVPGSPTAPAPQLMFIGILCLVSFIMATSLFITLPALTKVEEDELRAKLVSINMDTVFREGSTELTVNEFMAMLNEHHEGFSSMEIQVLFQMVDKDRSGLIDKHEILSYATKSGNIDVEDLYHQRQKYKDMKEDAEANVRTIGSMTNKTKIVLGYTQCISLAHVTFYSIPWPQELIDTMKNLEFTTFDIYALFGRLSCHMHSTFTQKFMYHMMLGPVVAICIMVAWYIGKFRLRSKHDQKYTTESMYTKIMTLSCLMGLGLYTGVSTRIFRVFRCDMVQDTYYLTADYSVTCFEGDWWNYGAFAIFCIVVYVVGIPLVQFMFLYRNRQFLYAATTPDIKRHRAVKKAFGPMYLHYKPACYYMI